MAGVRQNAILSNPPLKSGLEVISNLHYSQSINENLSRKSKKTKRKAVDNIPVKNSEMPWSEQEELEMLIAHKKYHNNWTNIAQAMRGRNNNSIKNRFYSIFRKIRNKIKKKDAVFTSRLEIIEAYYIIQLMEHCLNNPLPTSEPVGKRGKDFLYSLIKGIRVDEVKEYKIAIAKNIDSEIPLEDLWLEAVDQSSTDKLPAKDRLIDIVPYMRHPYIENRCCYILPVPDVISNPISLTTEEKYFIRSQVFHEKQSYPAETLFLQLTALSPANSMLLSASFSPDTTHSDGFSKFATAAYSQCSKFSTSFFQMANPMSMQI